MTCGTEKEEIHSPKSLTSVWIHVTDVYFKNICILQPWPTEHSKCVGKQKCARPTLFLRTNSAFVWTVHTGGVFPTVAFSFLSILAPSLLGFFPQTPAHLDLVFCLISTLVVLLINLWFLFQDNSLWKVTVFCLSFLVTRSC